MTIYNDLYSIDFRCEDAQKLEEIKTNASEAATNILIGVSAIGSLMFWAADSEYYSVEQAKDDMYRIGAMLMPLGEVVRALNDNADNAFFKVNELAKGGKE